MITVYTIGVEERMITVYTIGVEERMITVYTFGVEERMTTVYTIGVEERMITVHYYYDAVGRALPVGLFDCTQCPFWIQHLSVFV